MQIPITQILLPSSTQATREPLLQNLKPGQILQGTAMSGNIDGRLSLQIGVTRLIAQTQLSVRPGQALTLQVVKADILPELRLLLPPTLESLKATALKSLLPRQHPLPPLFKALAQVIQAPAQSRIPPPIREEAVALLNQLPSTTDPGFKNRLQRSLLESGLLTEPKLLRNLTESGDIKLRLVRLFENIRQLLPENRLLQSNLDPRLIPPQHKAQHKGTPENLAENGIKLLIGLLKHLDGAIARIQTHQLASLPQEDPSRQVWQFELPIRNGEDVDLFHIRIGREETARRSDEEMAWSLTLHMNLASLGPMRVQLRLQGEHLSTLIWSEQPRTNSLVQSHLSTLRTAYEARGLLVERLEAQLGAVGEPERIPVNTSLLHEQV
jgi:hypothetical protein